MLLASVKKIIQAEINNPQIIKQAFIHKSYLNEAKTFTGSNERLEFLGDSIISFLVSLYLFKKYPDLQEGQLTNLRSSVVKTATLAACSRNLGLGELLLLSKGEVEGGGRSNPSILADTFEAFIGALYLDNGIEKVEEILNNQLLSQIPKILEEKLYRDSKSSFQEVVQEKYKISPVYKVHSQKGPDHAKEFIIGAYVAGTLWGTGSGKNKQDAEQAAATAALEKWLKK